MTLNCAEDFSPLSGQDVVSETSGMIDASELCSDLSEAADVPILIWRPGDPITGAYPSSQRPWVLLQHGNGQDAAQYPHIIKPLVERGFIVFAPDDINTLSSIPGATAWERRGQRIECALRWVRSEFPESEERLGGCFAMIGHSNGGAGVVEAGRRLAAANDPLLRELAAVVAITPDIPTDFEEGIDAEDHFPLLVLTGSHDEQVEYGGVAAYEILGNEGRLNQASPAAGSMVGRVGEKVFIDAYRVLHNDWGGDSLNPLLQAPAGRELSGTYIPAFLDWQIFGDTSSRPWFVDNVIPSNIATLLDWNSHPEHDGTPLIFTAYQGGDRRGVGIQRLPIETFEDSNQSQPAYQYTGERISRTEAPSLVVQQGRQDELYDTAVLPQLPSLNHAMRVDWAASAGGVTWVFESPGFTPTHLSLRVSNVFDGWLTGPDTCEALPSEVPLSFDVHVETSNGGEGRAHVSEVVVQDYTLANNTQSNTTECDMSQSLYTVRIPIECLESSPQFDASLLNSIQLRFGDAGSSLSGALVIDSVELTASLEEPASPSCDHLGIPPAPLVSYSCVDYDPGSYIDFTATSGASSIGEATFDGAFGRFLAGRPSMVTDCDDSRYELDLVSVDQDADGVADETHDVRAFDNVGVTDLVATLGLEEGDAAVTINEPGKPASNGVELYDYGSFLAAYRRFSALQDVEVRFLREQAAGVHEPTLLMAYVPPDLSGVEPPQSAVTPSSYSLPSGATYVSSSTDLVNALALPTGQDIIVADGDYTWTAPVTVAGPHRIWSESLLGATLRFGLTYAGNANRTGGLELHGVAFEIDDASMAPAGVGSTHALFTWGQGGEDVLVEDCTFDGDLTIGDAIGAFAPNGLVVRRTEISNFWGYGIIAKQGAAGTVLGSEPLLEDLQIHSVFGANPGSSNGAWENGILLGNNGTIRRVDIRDVGWSGIQLYNDATGVSIGDVFIDYAGPGVWGTAYTQARGAGIWLGQSHDVSIDRVRIESHVFLGVNAHWDQGNADPFLNTTPPRNYNITISDLYSRAYKIGVHLDLGVEDTVVRSSRFEHAWMAGILDNNQFEDDWGWHPCAGGEDVCLQSLNRTDGIDCYLQDGVDCIAHHHNGGASAASPANWPSHPDDYLQPGGLWNRNDAAYPNEPGGGGDSSGGQVDSSTSG